MGGDWEPVFFEKILAAVMGITYKLLLVVLSGISSPRNAIASFWKFNPICPFFIVAFDKTSGMSESIFVLML